MTLHGNNVQRKPEEECSGYSLTTMTLQRLPLAEDVAVVGSSGGSNVANRTIISPPSILRSPGISQ